MAWKFSRSPWGIGTVSVIMALTLPFDIMAADLCPPLDGLVQELKAAFLPIRGERNPETGRYRTKNLLGAEACWIDEDADIMAYQCAWRFKGDLPAATKFFEETVAALARCIDGKALPSAAFGPPEAEPDSGDGWETTLVRHAISHPSLTRPAYVAVKLVRRRPARPEAGHEVFLDLVRNK